jgi:sugar O-acyltransferase (sialic acid O-acetyltransferase NeuD family)
VQKAVVRVAGTPRSWHAPPAACRRILIVGAGGFGREVLQWARDAWPSSQERIAGFLSADPRPLDDQGCDLGILGTTEAYRPQPGDGVLLAIGIPDVRRRVAESLLARGSEFLTLVHPTALVARTATIDTGAVVCPYAIVSDCCRIGRFVILNYHASLGHDAAAGDFSVLSPYATLGGGARIAEDVFLGLHASVGPGHTIGRRSRISANSCALFSAPADSIIFGVPGRLSPRIDAGLPGGGTQPEAQPHP